MYLNQIRVNGANPLEPAIIIQTGEGTHANISVDTSGNLTFSDKNFPNGVSFVPTSAVTLSNYYDKTDADATFQPIGSYLSANTFIPTDFYSKAQANANFLSANTSYYTQAQCNANFLSGNTSIPKVYYKKVSITGEQLITLTGTTLELIEAPGENKSIGILDIVGRFSTPTSAYTLGSSDNFQVKIGGVVVGTIYGDILKANLRSNRFIYSGSKNSNVFALDSSMTLNLDTTTLAVGDVESTITFYINYVINE